MRFFQLRVIIVSGQLAFSPARCTAYFFAGRILLRPRRVCLSKHSSRGMVVRFGSTRAGVAELADALDSKSSVRKDVWVRVPPPVLQALTRFSGLLG